MKHILLIFSLVFITSITFAQTSIAELNYGDVFIYNNIEVEFLKVVSDSRCPKNVQCIRAGEAKILVAVYKNGKFLKKKELIFFASGAVNETHNILIYTNVIKLKGLKLHPYPNDSGSIPDENYFLEIQIN